MTLFTRRGRGQGEELFDHVEKSNDVDIVVCSNVLSLDGLSRMDYSSTLEAGGVRGAGNEDVNLTRLLDDLGHAREVRLRCGIRFDSGVRVVFLQRCFRGGEDRFTALDDDDA
jgi:hypothetical protein